MTKRFYADFWQELLIRRNNVPRFVNYNTRPESPHSGQEHELTVIWNEHKHPRPKTDANVLSLHSIYFKIAFALNDMATGISLFCCIKDLFMAIQTHIYQPKAYAVVAQCTYLTIYSTLPQILIPQTPVICLWAGTA